LKISEGAMKKREKARENLESVAVNYAS